MTPLWLFIGYLFLAIGELSVAPIGISLVIRLAPKRLLGVLMGVWFGAIGIGNLSAGIVGRYWPVWPHHQFFLLLAILSGLAGLLLLSQRQRLNRVLGNGGHR